MPDIAPVLHYAAVARPVGRLHPLYLEHCSQEARAVLLRSDGCSLDHVYDVCNGLFAGAGTVSPRQEYCAGMIETQLDADAEAGYFRTALPSMAFYLRRPIFEENSLGSMRRRFRSGKRVFCILSRKAYDSFAADNEPGYLYPRAASAICGSCGCIVEHASFTGRRAAFDIEPPE